MHLMAMSSRIPYGLGALDTDTETIWHMAYGIYGIGHMAYGIGHMAHGIYITQRDIFKTVFFKKYGPIFAQ